MCLVFGSTWDFFFVRCCCYFVVTHLKNYTSPVWKFAHIYIVRIKGLRDTSAVPLGGAPLKNTVRRKMKTEHFKCFTPAEPAQSTCYTYSALFYRFAKGWFLYCNTNRSIYVCHARQLQ